MFRAGGRTADGGWWWTAADPTVLWDPDEQLWKAWWSAVFAAACDARMLEASSRALHVMYAQSPDGVSWQLQREPALRSHGSPGDWDYSTVETPAVIRVPGAPANRRFALVYAGENSVQHPDGGYVLPRVQGFAPWQLGLAFSSDGREFARLPAAQSPYAGRPLPFGQIEGLVLYAGDAFPAFPTAIYGIVADPEVVRVGSTFHLFFSSAGADATGTVVQSGAAVAYGISHATSADLIHWTVDPLNPVVVGAGQPTVYLSDAGFEMYYGHDTPAEQQATPIPSLVFSTLGFFHAASADGTQWRLDATRELGWDASVPDEELGLMNGAAAVTVGDELRLYYASWSPRPSADGGCAFVRPGLFRPGGQVLNLARKRLR